MFGAPSIPRVQVVVIEQHPNGWVADVQSYVRLTNGRYVLWLRLGDWWDSE